MKIKIHILIAFFSLQLSQFNVFSQDIDKTKALSIIKKNANQLSINFEESIQSPPIINNAYNDAESGVTYIYVQQTFNKIKLYNVIKSIALTNSEISNNEGDFIKDISKKINTSKPIITAFDATLAAANHLENPIYKPELVVVIDDFDANKKITFNKAKISRSNITAELMYFSNDDFKTFKLVWNIGIDNIASNDFWNVKVDATNGSILDKSNYTLYEAPHNHKEINCAKRENLVELKYSNIVKPIKAFKFAPAATSASYRVVAYPKENRNVAGGVTIETDPWLKAGALNNATTHGWHYDGANDFDITQGNNVFAYDDSLDQNFPGRFPTSTTTAPTLTFDFIPNFTKQPFLTNNREFATTNLFYINNIIHDLFYQYGFTEAAGNFQASNLGRGGQGNDYVLAEAQDGKSINNANFQTPPDGSNGRMQMYLWNSAAIRLDGSIDNGVITHEFGHGISNRLTGGPANTSCLNNYEQGGEGWSDYFALMVTTDWSKAKITDGTIKRAMGNYVKNYNNSGPGIRALPYTTSLALNPHSYIDVSNSSGYPRYDASGAIIPDVTSAHYIGEVWCSALWDMTWNIIQQTGYINPNLYNANNGGGNSIALRLVMEGLKLQKCSPGFIDSRNAILKADSILYGNIYHASIWNAFARRGMGYFALQGLASKTNDQTDESTAPNVLFTGRIISPNGTPITNAFYWNKKQNFLWRAKDSAKSQYQFELYQYFNKTLHGAKKLEVNKTNGINSSDVILTQRHVTNALKLNNAYKIIAADVTGDGQVNSQDVLRMKRLVLGTDTTFKNTVTNENRLWVFVDSSYQFPDTTNPFPFKDSFNYTTLNGNVTNQTFIGVRLGDVNWDWNSTLAKQSTVNSLQLTEVQVNSKWSKVQGNSTLNLKLSTLNSESLSAIQSTIHFDNTKFEFVNLTSFKNLSDFEFNASKANETGNIAILWIDKNGESKEFKKGEDLFTLTLRPLSSVDTRPLSEDLSLNNTITETFALNKNLDKTKIVLKQANQEAQTINEKQWFTVYPNPSKGNVTIQTSNVKQIEVIDLFGRVLKKEILNSQNSKYTTQLSKGVYIVKATMNNGSVNKEKLIVE